MVAEIRLFNGFQNGGRYIAHIEHTHMHARTHAHTHPFSGPFLGLPRWAGTRNAKPIWIYFTGARDSEWQWHQLGHMQVYTLLQTDNHANTPPLSFLQTGCPSCHPTNSVKALKANFSVLLRWPDLRKILMGSSTKGMQRNCCGRLKLVISDQSGYVSETVLGWDSGNYCMSSYKNSSTFITCKCYLEVICLPS